MVKRFEGKKILITGATGLIGSNLARSLLEDGAEVIAMGRSENRLKTVFADCLERTNFSYVTGNVTEGIPDLDAPVDYIFNAASPISGNDIQQHPVDVIMANLEGTKNCLEFLKHQGGGRLVVFSSMTVYGKAEREDKTVDESMTNVAEILESSSSPYSEVKRLIEVLVRAYILQYDIDAVISRIGYVYGYTSTMPNTAFYQFVDSIRHREDVLINHAGLPRRDNIYIDDVVEGLKVIAASGKTWESYNLASNGELENYAAIDEIATRLVRMANKMEEIKTNVSIPKMQGQRHAGIKLDTTKLKNLGWRLNFSLEEGLKRTLEQYLAKKN